MGAFTLELLRTNRLAKNKRMKKEFRKIIRRPIYREATKARTGQ